MRHFTVGLFIIMTWGVLIPSISLFGCAASRNSVVQNAPEKPPPPEVKEMYIQPGKTTDAEILEIFGPPDSVTQRRGNDVWTYDKISYEVSSSGSDLSLMLSEGRNEEAEPFMLIIFFDGNNIVRAYRLGPGKH